MQVVYYGRPIGLLLGDDKLDDWDECIIVRYPSLAAFMKMQVSAEYQAIVHLRTNALARSVAAPMQSLLQAHL